MRKFRSHKIVEAESISEVKFEAAQAPNSYLVLASGQEVHPSLDFFARGRPQVGDYLVRYEDGYLSWSPKKAFEEGYTEVEPTTLELGAAGRAAGPEVKY